jgi:hypothetical protein
MSDLTRKCAETDPSEALESEVEEAIALCRGDVRNALRITLIANAFLEAEIDRLNAQVSTGFARRRIRRRVATDDREKKPN